MRGTAREFGSRIFFGKRKPTELDRVTTKTGPHEIKTRNS
jgi:hypothetical protein